MKGMAQQKVKRGQDSNSFQGAHESEANSSGQFFDALTNIKS